MKRCRSPRAEGSSRAARCGRPSGDTTRGAAAATVRVPVEPADNMDPGPRLGPGVAVQEHDVAALDEGERAVVAAREPEVRLVPRRGARRAPRDARGTPCRASLALSTQTDSPGIVENSPACGRERTERQRRGVPGQYDDACVHARATIPARSAPADRAPAPAPATLRYPARATAPRANGSEPPWKARARPLPPGVPPASAEIRAGARDGPCASRRSSGRRAAASWSLSGPSS